MTKSSRYGDLIFDDQWGSWEKTFNMKYSEQRKCSPRLNFITDIILGLLVTPFALLWLIMSIQRFETDPNRAIMAFFPVPFIIGIGYVFFIIPFRIEEFTSIQLYSKGIKYGGNLFSRKTFDIIHYQDIKSIKMIKGPSLEEKKSNYGTYYVKYLYKSKGPGIDASYVNVKHNHEFISVLRSIFGEDKWNEIFTDSSGGSQAAWIEQVQNNNIGSSSTSPGVIYPDEVVMKPAKMKRLMKNRKILFPVYITYISYAMYVYMYPVLTSNEFNTSDIETIVFLWALASLVVSFFLVEMLSLHWLSRSRIRFELSGEPKLVLKYKPNDMLKMDPAVVFGTLLLTGVPLAFCFVWAFEIWEFPENATLFVMAVFLGTYVLWRKVFEERHYLITDQGIGFVKKFHNALFTLFLPWDAFSGFTVRKNHIMLHHKEASLRYSRLCPRRIPVFQNMNHARNIVGHYIPEQ